MESLIPHAPFEALPVAALVLIGIFALWVLTTGADWLVEGASELAVGLGIPKVVIGATIVSLGTTAPECAVSVMAAWEGDAGLALGNAVGSVIFDTAVIFGGGCLLATLPADRFLLRRQGWVQFGSAVLLAAFCYWQVYRHGDAAAIPRWIGAVLLSLLAVYLWVSVRWSRQQTQQAESGLELPAHGPAGGIVSQLARILVGLILVLAGSRVTIICVTVLARRLHIPEVVISATVVAIGTSLPECMVGLASIRKGHPELLVGNVVGADILNILFVTGAAAVAKDLPIIDPSASDPYVFLNLLLPVMLIVLAYFRLCITASIPAGRFQRWMGLPLVATYVAFSLISFLKESGSP